MKIEAFSRSHPDESYNGDGYFIAVMDKKMSLKHTAVSHSKSGKAKAVPEILDLKKCSTVLLAIVDGIGHGNKAAAITEKVIDCIKDNYKLELSLIIKECHDTIVYSRGAALGIALVNIVESYIHYIGVGNVIMQVAGNKNSSHKFITNDGIIGYNLPKRLLTSTYKYNPGSMVVMHSDGVNGRFNARTISGLTGLKNETVAESVIRIHGKDSDDATVVIMK